MDSFFQLLEILNEFIWSYIGFAFIVGLGGYFSLRTGFFQVRKFPAIFRSFYDFFVEKSGTGAGVHPLKTFFAAIGGMIGIGNIAGICTAVQIGGPGALFWTWAGALFGMLLQYSEVYLGLRYRVHNKSHGYDGGPMYFLPHAYKTKWIAPLICLLLCIYGVEFFIFNIMTNSIVSNWNWDKNWTVALLLVAIVVVSFGGVKRVGEVCSTLIPLFILSYLVMGSWVLIHHLADLPGIFQQIFVGAFTPQGAAGAFIGSTVQLTISMGFSRGAYSGDIGVGYASIIYAESRSRQLHRVASLPIIGVFLDSFVICSFSILLVLATQRWNSGIDVACMVQESLSLYFPYMHLFMPIFFFLLGYTTILAYFVAGIKCAKFLSPKWGPRIYYLYACTFLPIFAFVEARQAFVIMSLAGAFLLILNLTGLFLLRKEIHFEA